jgi:hypothetical protein
MDMSVSREYFISWGFMLCSSPLRVPYICGGCGDGGGVLEAEETLKEVGVQSIEKAALLYVIDRFSQAGLTLSSKKVDGQLKAHSHDCRQSNVSIFILTVGQLFDWNL